MVMSQALYRKYRSRSLDEVVGQDHITATLKQALESGRISHAYLFTGPRGVGKTSIARVLAHEVNEFPYTEETTHLDIIEIDAASNRRIDEVRELRERSRTVPVAGKYKVYIIDEVHMLTREAFNALLKTLEEPPAHCIFILATTEVHKVPDTIISRAQRFSFRPISLSEATRQLSKIAKNEQLTITQGALKLLAEHGNGSLRDSISLLDQLSSSGQTIDEAAVANNLGLPPAKAVERIIGYVKRGDSGEIIHALEEQSEAGINPTVLAKSLSRSIRNNLDSDQIDQSELTLLKALVEIPASLDPQESLELALLWAAAKRAGSKARPKPAGRKAIASDRPPAIAATKLASNDSDPQKIVAFSLDLWPSIIQRTKGEAASLYTALRLATPRLEDGKLILALPFALHQKRLNQAKHKELIGRFIEEATGDKLTIECLVNKSVINKSDKLTPTFDSPPILDVPASELPTDVIKNINNIFGNAEVLES